MAAYVLVADGGMARLMIAEGPPRKRQLQVLETLECAGARVDHRDPADDIGSRRTQGDFDPHAIESARFAKRIASRLEDLRRRGKLDDLLVIAEPRFLGELRKQFAPALGKRVSREIGRDFAHADLRHISRAISRPQ